MLCKGFFITFLFFLLVCFFEHSYAINDVSLEKGETELYLEAIKLFNKKKYKQAIGIFQKIEDLYPFSYYSMKAKLFSGISRYNIGDYSGAASDMDDYINIYSNGEDILYAYYLRIISYYMQINKVQLEQQTAYKTLELVAQYINLFPNSKYEDDIRRKERIVTEHLLAKEYLIGKFYLERGEYLAAIRRFQNVINDENSRYFFQSINFLMVAYSALGIDLEADKYRAMLAKLY